ncbi:MAG: DUF4169 family protein [Beijerinckiaceae bacterium]
MTGEVVNLRRARKAKSRNLAETEAANNRCRFGRAKSALALEAAKKALVDRHFEAHRRETPGSLDDGGLDDGGSDDVDGR